MTDPFFELDSPSSGHGAGEILRAARAKAGMTRKQLAHASGASERYLAMLETGEGNPTLSVLVALARALDMPLAELLPLGGERDVNRARAAAAMRRLNAPNLTRLSAWMAQDSAPDPDTKGNRILLVGLRGAGKTSLGQRLAESLNFPFIEMSKKIEDSYGGDIGLLIEMSGQAALRRYENLAWEEICAAYPAAVIAAPGGIVADAVLYEQMRATAHSVWLQASPEDHMARVMAQGDFRPMASNRAAMADLKAILQARTTDYARAEIHLDTSAHSFDAALEQLLASVGGRVRVQA